MTNRSPSKSTLEWMKVYPSTSDCFDSVQPTSSTKVPDIVVNERIKIANTARLVYINSK